MRLLVVEDDDRVAAALAGTLRRHGFEVVRARTGLAALDLLGTRPDLVLLDLRLPDQDGFEICARMRALSNIPIIMVTARGEQSSRLRGLYMGADDYVVKPFDLRELLARIHAVARRAGVPVGGEAAPGGTGTSASPGAAGGAPGAGPADTTGTGTPASAGARQTAVAPAARPDPTPWPTDQGRVQIGELVIDRATRQVLVSGQEVALARKEFNVLAQLASAPGVVFRREQIVAEVWGYGWHEAASHTLEVHIASLRGKLGLPGVVETVRGVGYRLAVGRAQGTTR
ncbi:MAG: response regulator [Frankia sp.]|nr:response regulator [Frankia sp.]